MEEVKSKLHYLKSKILQYSEIPDNIRLELSNDIFKVEQVLTIHSVVVPKGTLVCTGCKSANIKTHIEEYYECLDCGREFTK